ncbi:MAG: 50S ribosomal protein L17 [Alphaproteobacteria bacterium]
MRHRVSGKQLSRTTSHRKALRRNMAASLIQHGAIRTTEVKAKELRSFVERIITTAKKGTLHARRRVISKLSDRAMTDNDGEFLDKSVVQKLFDEVAPKYADRPGGYTRIIRLDERRIGDAGRQVILQLVEESSDRQSPSEGTSRRKARAARRHQAGQVLEASTDQQELQGPEEQAGDDRADETDDESQVENDQAAGGQEPAAKDE